MASTLRSGSRGEEVRQLQQALAAAGFSPGAIDGIYGPATERAVRAFQQAKGLAVDGIAGPQTWAALGGGGSAPASSEPAAAVGGGSPDDLAQKKYPQYAWALNHWELGPILRKAAAEGWGPEDLQGAIYGTDWWRNTSAPLRRWSVLENTDPASAAQEWTSVRKHVEDLAASMGVPLGPLAVEELVGRITKLGQSDAEIRDQLAEWYTRGSGPATGQAEAIEQQIRATAYQYGIKVDDAWIQNTQRQILAGNLDENYITAQFQDWAKGKYPSIARQIDEGMTPTQIFEAFRQQAAGDLGISPDSIDLNDPKWNIVFNQPGKDGPQLMTLYDFQRLYRTRPEYGWDASQQGIRRGVNLVSAMAETFGAI